MEKSAYGYPPPPPPPCPRMLYSVHPPRAPPPSSPTFCALSFLFLCLPVPLPEICYLHLAGEGGEKKKRKGCAGGAV